MSFANGERLTDLWLLPKDFTMKPLPAAGRSVDSVKAEEFDQLKRRIHNKLVDKLDLSRIGIQVLRPGL